MPRQDERAAFDVIERAFFGGEGARAAAVDDGSAVELGRPGFAPDSPGTRRPPATRVVGASMLVIAFDEGEGWVDQLAVAREHRGRGLALRAARGTRFGVTWRRGGLRLAGLGTDTRTGARGLYEHVGMHVRRAPAFAKPL